MRPRRAIVTSAVLACLVVGGLGVLDTAHADVPSQPRAVHGPRNASEIVGHRVVGASTATHTTFVNVAAIRSHPLGARLGRVFAATPAWAAVASALPTSPAPDGGAPTTVDPLHVAEWVVLFGPSLVKNQAVVAIARTGVSDSAVDSTFKTISSGTTHGGAFDTGVPGVVAVRANPDRNDRVLMRVQPGIVIVAPPDRAAELARTEQHATFPVRVRPSEALRIVIKDPSRQFSASGSFPANMTELRAWIDVHDDGSADGWMEGDCDTHEHAEEARAWFDSTLSQNNSMMVRIATRDLLNGATTSTAGNTMKLHLPATREQLEAIIGFLEANFGVPTTP